MGFGLLVIGAIAVIIGRLTKPEQNTFELYFQRQKGFLARLLQRKREIVFRDFWFCWLVQIEQGSKSLLFIGIYGGWLYIYETQIVEREMGSSSTSIVEPGETDEKQGIALKAAGHYSEASASFARAANARRKELDAGNMWKSAAQCAKMAGDIEAYQTWSRDAANCFEGQGRFMQAALVLDSLASNLEGEKKRNVLMKAVQLFEADDDGRALDCRARLAEAHLEIGELHEAGSELLRQADLRYGKDPRLFVRMACGYRFKGLLCLYAIHETVSDSPPWFLESEEHRFIELLYEDSYDPEAKVQQLDRLLARMASLHSPYEQLWRQIRTELLTSLT